MAQGDVKAPGVPEGVYTVNIDGQATTDWEIYPICVPTVGDLREPLLLPVACRLKVTPDRQPGAEAVMVGNQWQFVYDEADGRTCPDGTRAPQTTIYRFDPYAWVGSMKVLHGDECGDQPAMVIVPLTMSFSEAAGHPRHRLPADLRAGRPAPLLLTLPGEPSVGRGAGRGLRASRSASPTLRRWYPSSAAQWQGRRPDRPRAHGALGCYVHRSGGVGGGAEREAGVRFR